MTITEDKFNGAAVETDITDDIMLNLDLGRLKVLRPTLKGQRVYLQNAQLTPWIAGGVVYDIMNIGSYSLFIFDWEGNFTGIEIAPNQRGGISLGNTSPEQGDAWRCNCRDILSGTTTTSTTSTTSSTTTPTTTSSTGITVTFSQIDDDSIITATWGEPPGNHGLSPEDPRFDPNYTNLPIFSKPAAFGELGPRVPRMRLPAALSVAVVVTTINEGSDFEQTLESILTSSRVPESIVVVDDGSIDSFEDRARAFDCQGANIVFVRNEFRRGCAQSRDAGFRAVEADVYIFIDSHMDFPTNWLDEMLAAHAQHPNSILVPISSDIALDGSAPLVNGHWGTGADLRMHRTEGIKAIWAPISDLSKPTLRVPAIMGACYLAPKQLLRDIGGWAMGLRGWGLDEEFACVRAWMMGYEVRLVTSVHVSHKYTRDLTALARIDATGNTEPGWVLRYTRQYVNFVLFGSVVGDLFGGECEETDRAREEMKANYTEWLADREYVQNRRILDDDKLWDLLSEIRVESNIVVEGNRVAHNQ